MTDRERAIFWEDVAARHEAEAQYYQAELEKAHALLGRVVHQLSERWDTVHLTKWFPTDNLTNKRCVTDPTGKEKPLTTGS